MRLRLLVRHEPWAWIDLISLGGVKHRGVFIDEVLPRHEVIWAEPLTHGIPGIELLTGITMAIRVQDKGELRVIGADLVAIAQHLLLELVQNQTLLWQVIILNQLRQPLRYLIDLFCFHVTDIGHRYLIRANLPLWVQR